MKRKYINILFIFLLLTDIAYSFNQHFNYTLDGDLAGITLPSSGYAPIWNDPFGFDLIFRNKVTSSPNRFFAHATMAEYFRHVPNALQIIASPVDSVYLSIAIAKTLIQILIIYLLAAFVSNTNKLFRKDFLLAAVLITPLFQTKGFIRSMGIIDVAPTYVFFYALPVGLLLSFFYIFFKLEMNEGGFRLKIYHWIWLLFLVFFLPLNGPLVPGIVLIVCPAILLGKWYQNYRKSNSLTLYPRVLSSIQKIKGIYWIYFLLLILFCLYSLYIGRNDYENQHAIPLFERYKRLPLGFFNMLTQKPGLPVLILFVIVNSVLISRANPTPEGRKALTILKLICWIGLLYILLLPLGGYRTYRENIIRYDTFMPITLAIMFFYALSSIYLVKHFHAKYRIIYIAALFCNSLFFTLADRPVHENVRERNALMQISESSEKIVPLNVDCNVMSWGKITNPEDSRLNCTLLEYWGIIKEPKLYYQK